MDPSATRPRRGGPRDGGRHASAAVGLRVLLTGRHDSADHVAPHRTINDSCCPPRGSTTAPTDVQAFFALRDRCLTAKQTTAMARHPQEKAWFGEWQKAVAPYPGDHGLTYLPVAPTETCEEQ